MLWLGVCLGQTMGLELTLIEIEIELELNWKRLPFEGVRYENENR